MEPIVFLGQFFTSDLMAVEVALLLWAKGLKLALEVFQFFEGVVGALQGLSVCQFFVLPGQSLAQDFLGFIGLDDVVPQVGAPRVRLLAVLFCPFFGLKQLLF